VDEELPSVGAGDLDPDALLNGGGGRIWSVVGEEERVNGVEDRGGIDLELGLVDVGHGREGDEEEEREERSCVVVGMLSMLFKYRVHDILIDGFVWMWMTSG
jgi:hypothetical protein